MSGAWVFVCGASGAGKDSVIARARDRLAGNADVIFSQRLMTRATPAGADHQEMEAAPFERLLRGGGLAWHWQAHGFHYGIAARYAQQVAWERVVVVNGSREHVAGLPRGPHLHVVQIDARAEDVASRLTHRGREAPEAVASRLERNTRLERVDADMVITNDGELALAGERLVDYLTALAPRARRVARRNSLSGKELST